MTFIIIASVVSQEDRRQLDERQHTHTTHLCISNLPLWLFLFSSLCLFKSSFLLLLLLSFSCSNWQPTCLRPTLFLVDVRLDVILFTHSFFLLVTFQLLSSIKHQIGHQRKTSSIVPGPYLKNQPLDLHLTCLISKCTVNKPTDWSSLSHGHF